MANRPREPTVATNQRFGRLVERADGADFPFYDGWPVALSGTRWIVIVAACALGFVALVVPVLPGQGGLLLSRTLFVAIPAAVFVACTRRSARRLFRRLHAVDVWTMVVFWLINLMTSALVAFAVSGGQLSGLTANSATDDVAAGGATTVVLFYLGTFVQLFGEELFTVLPFLAVLYLAHTRLGLTRRRSIVIAWVLTALWFGAAHLPTYGYDVVQALVVIGSARIVLTLAYIRTKNIAVSFGAHLINDWATFTFVLVVGALRG